MSSIALRLPITDRAGIKAGVDARALHAELGIGRDFSTWLRGITTSQSAIPNVDFVVIRASGGTVAFGPAARVEAALSLRVALVAASRAGVGSEVFEYLAENIAAREPPVAADLSSANSLRDLVSRFVARLSGVASRFFDQESN
jgi:hypothetical protein